jgi:transcriptional regulator with XRE-family HTH domain
MPKSDEARERLSDVNARARDEAMARSCAFARELLELMAGRGLVGHGSQERLRTVLRRGHGVAVSKSTISFWLSGQRTPSPRMTLAIANALEHPDPLTFVKVLHPQIRGLDDYELGGCSV